MTDSKVLLELAARCEKAEAREQHALLAEAFSLCCPRPESYLEPRSYPVAPDDPLFDLADRLRAYTRAADKIRAMLNAEAYESAAMTLVPARFGYGVAEPKGGVAPSGLIFNRTGLHIEVRAATPALALCAAALRSHAAQDKVGDGR